MALNIGLSPRVRGNRLCGWQQVNPYGSIPACTGEPSQIPDTACGTYRSIPACTGEPIGAACPCPQAPVYPRVYGGTSFPPLPTGTSSGLSPRVRGNRRYLCRRSLVNGSIPACTGEPSQRGEYRRQRWVYPRVYGGTSPFSLAAHSSNGLSPRVRGNHIRQRTLLHRSGSIPACTGEPRQSRRERE